MILEKITELQILHYIQANFVKHFLLFYIILYYFILLYIYTYTRIFNIIHTFNMTHNILENINSSRLISQFARQIVHFDK